MKTNGNGHSATSRQAIKRVAAIAHQAVDSAAGVAAPTADWLSGRSDDLRAKKEQLVADTCGYVTANPLKAVGIAVVAGFLLSRILL